MRSILCSALTLCVAFTTAPVRAVSAAPTEPVPAPSQPPSIPEDDPTAVDLAEKAWLEGKWTEVRRLLEPLAEDGGRLQDAIVREKALLYLADATVQDASLDAEERRTRASAHLNRLIDADPNWQLQRGAYSEQLYELYRDVQDQRAEEVARACGASLEACRADLEEEQAQLDALRAEQRELQADFAEQEVQVEERVARSRIFAAIPFGVGHFYNGEPALGGSFLAAEVAFGAAGLGLLLYRVAGDGCDREEGFQSGSVECAPGRDLDAIVKRRNAEEVMGWLFLGTLVLDVIIAQIRFQPYETKAVRRVKRKELESGSSSPTREKGRTRDRRRRDRRRARVRPAPGMVPGGVSLGVDIRF